MKSVRSMKTVKENVHVGVVEGPEMPMVIEEEYLGIIEPFELHFKSKKN